MRDRSPGLSLLAEIDLRGRHGVNVIGIPRGDARLLVAGAAGDVESLCGEGGVCERIEAEPRQSFS